LIERIISRWSVSAVMRIADGFRMRNAGAAKELHAAHVAHALTAQHEIDAFAIQQRQRIVARGRGKGAVILLEVVRQRRAGMWIVVDHQHGP
jgi:hypothetical protein